MFCCSHYPLCISLSSYTDPFIRHPVFFQIKRDLSVKTSARFHVTEAAFCSTTTAALSQVEQFQCGWLNTVGSHHCKQTKKKDML